MSNALANVYSFGNKLRNNLKALLTDPVNHLASQANIWAADMNRALDSPATAYRRAGGVMADDPSTVAAANREQERMTAALMGTAPGFVGMTAWHGSPHKFDRFDASKIGTGEGAQAYGHGFYLAESPEVAKGYSLMGDQNPTAQQYLRMWGGDRAKAEAAFLKDVNEGAFGKYTSQIAKDGDVLASIRGKGQLYKVDLPDEMVARMLDWDKPLSQQALEVQRAVAASDHPMMQYWAAKSKENPAYNGADLLLRLGGEKGDKAAASELLRKSGIPGIRYLDQGSRGTGSGTSNFVVFPGEENALRILERNGMTLADMAGQSGKIDSRLLAALGLGSAAAFSGNSLLNSGKKKMEDAKKARQQAIDKAEEK